MSSLLGLFKFAADPETQLQQIVFWQMGSLANVRNARVMSSYARHTGVHRHRDAAQLAHQHSVLWRKRGKDTGRQHQVASRHRHCMRQLIDGVRSGISGTIGWVGLVIPHLGRLLVGPDNTRLLPTAALLGAVFMLGIDTAARVATSLEIPLSILTGLIGHRLRLVAV